MTNLFRLWAALSLGLGLLVSGTAMAGGVLTPESLDGIDVVNVKQVDAAARTGALLVDFRYKSAFEKGTIAGSVSCPGIQGQPAELSTTEVAAAKDVLMSCPAVVNAAKDREIISYCSGAKCWISPKAAMALKGMGFTNVKWFRTGSNSWVKSGRALK